MNYYKNISIIFLLIVFSLDLKTQSLKDTLKIKEVNIIERYKKDTIIEIFDSLKKQQFSNTQLNKFLTYLPNISVRNYSNGMISTFSIRGTNSAQNIVKWNGLELNSPLNGNADISNIPVFFVDEISIYEGSSSLKKSNGAIGGILTLDNNIECIRNGFHFSLIQEFASFSTYSTYLNIDYKKNRIANSLKVFYKQSENNYSFINDFVIPNEISKLRNSDYSKIGFINDFNIYLKPNFITSIKYWINNSSSNIPSIILNYDATNYSENQSELSNRLVISNVIKRKTTEASLIFGISNNYLKYNLSHFNENSTINSISTISTSDDIFAKINYQYKQNNHELLNTSFEQKYQYGFYENRLDSSNNSVNRNISSLYFNINSTQLKKYSNSLNIRVIYNNKFYYCPAIYNKIFLNKTKTIDLNIDISKNVKLPSLNDLYYYPGGNISLKEEISKNLDLYLNLIIKKNNSIVFYSTKAYYSEISNWIQWRPTAYGYWMASNIDDVISRGINNQIKLSTQIFQFTYSVDLNYTYLKINSIVNHNMQLIYTPYNIFNANIFLAYKHFNISLLSHYESKRNISLGNQPKNFLPDYIINDILLEYKFNCINIESIVRLSINNVFNANYQLVIWRPMPLRNYSITLKFYF